MNSRIFLCVIVAVATFTLFAAAQSFNQIVVIQPVGHATSPQLSDLLPGPRSPERQVVPLFKPNRPGKGGGGGGGAFTDPLWQKSTGTASPILGFSFEGMGDGMSGYSDNYIPPDTNGAVGNYQYVQAVNVDLTAFDKSSGASVFGPVPLNTFWSAVGGPCAQNNGGDPIVQFDKINNRWVVMQIQYSGSGGGGGNYLCVAVSNEDDWSDHTGFRFNAYSYKFSTLTDYPKMGIWNDGYYVTFNAFKGFGTFAGPVACAFDGATMRSGGNASVQCTALSTKYSSLLPADIDSTSEAPITDEPEYLVSMGNNSLNVWRFHVDWGNSANSVLTGPVNATHDSIPSINFAAACGGGTCIPQSGTTQQLDSLGDRLMYRLAYRNFGTSESLVVNHSVMTDSTTTGMSGIRWYELQNSPSSNYLSPPVPDIYQAGTYAPDSNYRWMGSVAMDDAGDIAVGYSVSSSSMSPTIAIAGRCSNSTDAPGTLGKEVQMLNGISTQSQTGYNRWGDYSSMSVDPKDGSLWFTTEYLTELGSNWHTRIGRFTLGCP
jgi:hypothetical protein